MPNEYKRYTRKMWLYIWLRNALNILDFVTKLQLNLHFLWDIFKYHTKIVNLCTRICLICRLVKKVSKWLLYDHDCSTFTFYEIFSNSISKWATFVKQVFWFNDLFRKWRNDCFVTKWQVNFHFLCDILK